MSRGRRAVLDWIVTIALAVLIVLGVKNWVVNPYRIPSPSMEPTLHCARPEPYCEASSSDRILANRFIYRFRDPHRGEIVVFHTPPAAKRECPGDIFVKRIIGLPGEAWSERRGFTYIDGRPLAEPYLHAGRRDDHDARHSARRNAATHPEGHVPRRGRQPQPLVRLPGLGARAAQEHHR